MIRVAGIIGEPATGKSTLMKAIMSDLERVDSRSTFCWLSYVSERRTLPARIYSIERVIVLGYYDREFGGTDSMHMAVQPELERFILYTNQAPNWDGWTILWEGDRLTNEKFFTFLDDNKIEYIVTPLRTSDSNLQVRHAQRKDTQTESWLRGRRNKIDKIVAKHGWLKLFHDTTDNTKTLADQILGWIRKEDE